MRDKDGIWSIHSSIIANRERRQVYLTIVANGHEEKLIQQVLQAHPWRRPSVTRSITEAHRSKPDGLTTLSLTGLSLHPTPKRQWYLMARRYQGLPEEHVYATKSDCCSLWRCKQQHDSASLRVWTFRVRRADRLWNEHE